jgi:hypothetical protein
VRVERSDAGADAEAMSMVTSTLPVLAAGSRVMRALLLVEAAAARADPKLKCLISKVAKVCEPSMA